MRTRFEVGDEVIVNNCSTEYGGQFTGRAGRVAKLGGYGNYQCVGSIGVDLDGLYNDNSQYGIFYFTAGHLNLKRQTNIKEENKEMAINGNYKVAVVKIEEYCGNKEYNFALFPEEEAQLVEGIDHVLVRDSNADRVAKVIRIVPKEEVSVRPTKEVVCVLDFRNYNKRVADRDAKKKLRAEMDAMAKQEQELVVFQMLAEKNPKMAELLKAYQALGDI